MQLNTHEDFKPYCLDQAVNASSPSQEGILEREHTYRCKKVGYFQGAVRNWKKKKYTRNKRNHTEGKLEDRNIPCIKTYSFYLLKQRIRDIFGPILVLLIISLNSHPQLVFSPSRRTAISLLLVGEDRISTHVHHRQGDLQYQL